MPGVFEEQYGLQLSEAEEMRSESKARQVIRVIGHPKAFGFYSEHDGSHCKSLSTDVTCWGYFFVQRKSF